MKYKYKKLKQTFQYKQIGSEKHAPINTKAHCLFAATTEEKDYHINTGIHRLYRSMETAVPYFEVLP
jgi:hypothetical protein